MNASGLHCTESPAPPASQGAINAYFTFVAFHGCIGASLNAFIVYLSKSKEVAGIDVALFVGASALGDASACSMRFIKQWGSNLVRDYGPFESTFCLGGVFSVMFSVLIINLSIHPIMLQRFLKFVHEKGHDLLFGTKRRRVVMAIIPYLIAITTALVGVSQLEAKGRRPSGTCRNLKFEGSWFSAVLTFYLWIQRVHYLLCCIYTAGVTYLLRARAKDRAAKDDEEAVRDTHRIMIGLILVPITGSLTDWSYVFYDKTIRRHSSNVLLSLASCFEAERWNLFRPPNYSPPAREYRPTPQGRWPHAFDAIYDIILGCWLQILVPSLLTQPSVIVHWVGKNTCFRIPTIVGYFLTELVHLSPIANALIVFTVLVPYKNALKAALRRALGVNSTNVYTINNNTSEWNNRSRYSVSRPRAMSLAKSFEAVAKAEGER